MWTTLLVIAIISLIFFRGSRNSVWGGLTIGVFIGFILALISYFRGNGFQWSIIGKSMIVATLIGVIAELLGKLSNRIKRKNN